MDACLVSARPVDRTRPDQTGAVFLLRERFIGGREPQVAIGHFYLFRVIVLLFVVRAIGPIDSFPEFVVQAIAVEFIVPRKLPARQRFDGQNWTRPAGTET